MKSIADNKGCLLCILKHTRKYCSISKVNKEKSIPASTSCDAWKYHYIYMSDKETKLSPDACVDILCCRYDGKMRRFYNFTRLQINSILSNKLKLCVTNSCFLRPWWQEPKAVRLLRASLVVCDVPWWEVIAGPIHSFTAFCKVAFKDRHNGAPHLSPLSALLFRATAISCTPRQEEVTETGERACDVPKRRLWETKATTTQT